MKRYTHDLETDLNDVDKTPSLIHKTLLTASTIYDLKYLAQVLNDENGSNWSRASLKRQVTCIPEHCELSIADGRYLQTLIPSRPADYEDRHFSFIDLFAGIGGLRSDLMPSVVNVFSRANGILIPAVLTGRTGIAMRTSTASIQTSVTSLLATGPRLLMTRHTNLSMPLSRIMMFFLRDFHASHSASPVSVKRTLWVANTVSSATLRVRSSLMWPGSSGQNNLQFLFWKT